MKTIKHPLLDLIINEDGTVIIWQGKELPILHYNTSRDNYTMKRVNFLNRTHTVGKLVCEAWNGMRERMDQTLRRRDLNPDNDHYTNLYWGAPGGPHNARTKRSSTSKIKADEIKDVISRIDRGETLKNIAKSFNTSDMSICRIKKRYMQDQLMRLKDKVRHCQSTHARKTAYAKYMGFDNVADAIGKLGNDRFDKTIHALLLEF